MNAQKAEMYARRMEILFKANAWGAAHEAVEQAMNEPTGAWYLDFETFGLDQHYCMALADAGLYCPGDVKNETLKSLREIELIGLGGALAILSIVRKCHELDRVGDADAVCCDDI